MSKKRGSYHYLDKKCSFYKNFKKIAKKIKKLRKNVDFI